MMRFNGDPKIRGVLSLEDQARDKEIDLNYGYIFFTASDGTEIKVEMREDGLYIWNQGNTANFSLSVSPVSSNVVKINPSR